jgi:hypothetical protein
MGIDYTIKAIETNYKGFTFRSRLEARWAAMFDLLGWNWDYEPSDFNGWMPDFILFGKTKRIYVEVKPVVRFPIDVSKKMQDSGCENEMLIVGQVCPLPECPEEFAEDDNELGWIVYPYSEDDQLSGGWDRARFGIWSLKNIGYCSVNHQWNDRISGEYSGNAFSGLAKAEIKRMWGEAHLATRWNKGK